MLLNIEMHKDKDKVFATMLSNLN